MTLPDKDCMVAIRWRPDGPWVPALYSHDSKMFDVTGYQSAFGPSEIHSYRILVFADEVGKHIEEAHLEGWLNCWKSLCNEDTGHLAHWNTSHAKQQAEGLTK